MTRILSTIALIGLVSAGPALAHSSNGAQVFDRNSVAIQSGEAAAAVQARTQANAQTQNAVAFDRADRSLTSDR